jgi:hypothetical protein
MRHPSPLLSFLALACSFLPLGCAESGVRQVKGTVTFDDTPLAGADITFEPADPGELHLGSFGGQTGPDGKFQINLGPGTGRNARPGRFVVLVTKGAGVGLPAPDAGDEERTKELMKRTAPGVSRGILPEVYADRDRSPFRADIRKGISEVGPFHLRSRPKER